MPDDVAMRTAARELGLQPRLVELAVQVGEVRTGWAAGSGPRRVPRAELARLKASAGFPWSLRERLRVVNAAKGAELLGISPARFARLARGGCFTPVHFYVNRYRTVVWLYLAGELRAFAERGAELLTGRVPKGLRVLLAEGVDFRPRHWRCRRVRQLSQQAAGPWDAAASRAAVLDAGALAEAVPDPRERARLAAGAPELVTLRRDQSVATREAAGELCVATAEDEVFWHRLMLAADLEEARAAEPLCTAAEAASQPAVEAGSRDKGGCDEVVLLAPAPASTPVSRTGATDTPVPRQRSVAEPVPLPAQGPCSGPGPVRRRAHVLARLRGRRRQRRWWRRAGGVSHPAF